VESDRNPAAIYVPNNVPDTCHCEQIYVPKYVHIRQIYVPDYAPDTCHYGQIYVLKYVHIRPNLCTHMYPNTNINPYLNTYQYVLKYVHIRPNICTHMYLNTNIKPYPNTYQYVPTNTYQNTYHYGVNIVVRIFGYYVPTMDRHNP
jgi:hypothetical protein